jgi:hypothetical protein
MGGSLWACGCIASWAVATAERYAASPSSGPVCARPEPPWRIGRASCSVGGPFMLACAMMAKVNIILCIITHHTITYKASNTVSEIPNSSTHKGHQILGRKKAQQGKGSSYSRYMASSVGMHKGMTMLVRTASIYR